MGELRLGNFSGLVLRAQEAMANIAWQGGRMVYCLGLDFNPVFR